MTAIDQLRARCRVLVDNDWAGDPDGLVALAHHLLSPTNRVVGVTSSLINPMFPGWEDGATRGSVIAAELLTLLGADAGIATGNETTWAPGHTSAASELIVAEALRDDPLHLFLVCGGPLTNVAAALASAPEIAARCTLIWIGGSHEEGRFEYNRDTDPDAAASVLSTPGLVVEQFTVEAYRQCAYSLAELEADLATAGEVGAWLWRRFSGPLPDGIELGAVWPLGDSPPVLLTALDVESSEAVPRPSGPGRVWTRLDTRLLFADMLARFRLHARSGS